MMGAVATGALTGAIVTTGVWAKGNDLSPRYLVSGAFLAVGLIVFENINPELAGKFGALILLGALLSYGIPIANAVGLSTRTPKKPAVGKKKGPN